MNNLSRRSLIRGAAVLPATGLGLVSTADASSSSNLKTVESTLSQIRRRRARGTSGLWPSSP